MRLRGDEGLLARLRELTLCHLGWGHSRRSRTVVKWDGGRLAHLCPACRLILWRERS